MSQILGSKLRKLSLTGLKGGSVEPGAFQDSQIDKLDLHFRLASNKLSFVGLENLRVLNLRKCFLRAEQLNGCLDPLVNLSEAYLGYNELASWQSSELFRNQKRLIVLQMCRNRIEVLREDMFAGLETLRAIDLSSNRIRRVEVNAFKGLVNLKSLKLSRNYLDYSQADVVFDSLSTHVEIEIEI